MNYQKIYDSLVDRGRHRIIVGYFEKHHIIPRCIGGSDEDHNLVDLTPEEHFLAHLLLVKLYPQDRKILFAAWMMACSGNKHQLNEGRSKNKLYGWLKRRRSEIGISEETRNKIRKARAKQIITDEQKAKMSETLRKGYANGTNVMSAERKEKIGKTNSRIIREKVKNGTHIVWNKGVPMTDETKHKLSIVFKDQYANGRELSPTSFKEGHVPWNKGKPQDTVKCPHCRKEGGISVMKRWHFNNCKNIK